MKNLKLYAWMVAILCTVLLPSVHAARFYVDANAALGGDGVSWGTAFRYLQDALDQTISERGDDIWIAAGIYHPDDGANVTEGDRQASFFLKDGVKLYGGFAGGETELDQRDWEENETILSGKISDHEVFWSIHICTIESEGEILFDGLSVTGGRTDGFAAAVYSSLVYVVRVNNSRFTDNSADRGGVARGGTWHVSNSSFSGNSAGYGGVAYESTWHVSNSSFSGNIATFRGGVDHESTWHVSNSSFSGNRAQYGGVAYESTWHVINSSFSTNRGLFDGGVAYKGTWNVSNNSSFISNSTGGSAGVLFQVDCDVSNSSFSENSASRNGGVAVGGTWNVFNSTFTKNRASQDSGVASGGTWNVSNSLFSENSASRNAGVSYSGTWNVSNSSFYGNSSKDTIPTRGGGVAYFGSWKVSNSTFSGNTAGNGGGVAYYGSWNVSNSIFTGNTALGGGVALDSTWHVSNSSFSGNSAGSGGVGRKGSWILLNSIIDAQNFGDDGSLFSYMTRITDTTDTLPSPISPRAKNIIQGGLDVISMSTASNSDLIPILGEDSLIDADPLFIDVSNPAGPDSIWGTADDGLRLQAGSPAIGQGNPDFLPLDTFDLDNDGVTDEPVPIDRAGFPRVQGGSLDLGAYEFDGEENPMLSLTVQSTAGGSTSPSGQNNHALGTEITLTATPSPGNVFEGWTGGLESPDSVLTFTISNHLILTANFGHDLADDDDDGLTNYQEIVVYGTDPQNPDSSGDGIRDGEAVAAELNPLVDYSAVIGVVNTNPERFNLYNESSIMDLNLGGFMMRKVGNSVEIQFTIQKANNLVEGDWEDYQTISHTIDLPVSNYFMRLRAGADQQD